MCPVMIITIYFEADHKKLVSSQKSSIFGPQKGHFGQSGPWNGPPSGQTTTYQKTKGIQSSLRIWRSCHPIESGPSEPKKWGFHRCSVKKRRISGKKCSFLARNPFFLEIVQLCLSPPWPDTKKTTLDYISQLSRKFPEHNYIEVHGPSRTTLNPPRLGRNLNIRLIKKVQRARTNLAELTMQMVTYLQE